MTSNSRKQEPPFKLSICITTRNRAGFVGETLDSIIEQTTNECEIVVFDGASTDNTEAVVTARKHRFPNINYCKQDKNDGLDRGFDHAVSLARGDYCWLMPDDDLLTAGAVERVLQAVRSGYSLVVANVEYRNFDMSSVLTLDDLQVQIDRDLEFRPDEIDELFELCWRLIRYSGSIVIKRSVWLARQREEFFGSFWMDVAIVFQQKLPAGAYLIAKPCVSVRMGNQSWLSSWFEIFCVHWPRVVSALAVSESVKRKACVDKPWQSASFLLMGRAAGQYSLQEYRSHIRPRLHSIKDKALAFAIAICPGVLLNRLFLLYYARVANHYGRSMTLLLTSSPFNSSQKTAGAARG